MRDVRVVARDFGGGDERLVAFVVGKEGASPGHASLRALVHLSLPNYMAPAIFVTLDALPLTATGKLDHKALTSMPLQFAESEGETAQPIASKLGLVHVWREVLRVPAVDVDDNFFELGGHSLLAMNMLARVEKEFGCQLGRQRDGAEPDGPRASPTSSAAAGPSDATTMIVPFSAVAPARRSSVSRRTTPSTSRRWPRR